MADERPDGIVFDPEGWLTPGLSTVVIVDPPVDPEGD